MKKMCTMKTKERDRTRTSAEVPVRCGGVMLLTTAEVRLRGEGGADWFISLTFRVEPGEHGEVPPMTYHQLRVGDLESFGHKCNCDEIPSGIAEVINDSGLGVRLDHPPYGSCWQISAEFAYRCLEATDFTEDLGAQWESQRLPSFAWVITDNLMPVQRDEYHYEGTRYWENRGHGPRISPAQETLLLNGIGTEFLLLDDDDNHLFKGVFLGDWHGQNGFSPKDDWAEPEFSATEIRYKINGEWRTL